MSLLKVEDLHTEFKTDQGIVHAVRGVSFELNQGEALGIVGESGSGKSQTMYTIMGLLSENALPVKGKVTFDGKDISAESFKSKKEYNKMMNEIRGNTVAMIFQDPMTFLNPVLKIGTQLIEPIMNHKKVSKKEAYDMAIKLMKQVGIPSAEKRINQYPFEFSGGMRQRIIIAIALACNPKLIIADEPTTALDVTIQAQVLELINSLKEESDSSIIMITHDLGVVAKLCDRVAIMYGGKIVEIGTDREIFYESKHPYTQGLLSCITNPEDDSDEDLQPIPGTPPDLLKPPVGCPFYARCQHAMSFLRKDMQMIFQDPYASLNPRMTVGEIIKEPMKIFNIYDTDEEREARVRELLDIVSLKPDHIRRYPAEFSGGQRQRIGIARALAVNPKFIVCDEPISALDASIQAQVINLLKHIQKEMGISYIFIAHDLGMVKHISDRIGVMYLGHIVECGPSDVVYHTPLHPYTQALLSAIPIPDPDVAKAKQRIVLEGEIPSPINTPAGCPFASRCPRATERCRKETPKPVQLGERSVACFLYEK